MQTDLRTIDVEDEENYSTKYSHSRRSICAKYFSFCRVCLQVHSHHAVDHCCSSGLVPIFHIGDSGEQEAD